MRTTYEEFKTFIENRTPFTAKEVDIEKIVKPAVEDTLALINKYRPKIIKIYSPACPEEYKDRRFRILRSYDSRQNPMSSNNSNILLEDEIVSGVYYVASVEWTMEDVDGNDKAAEYFGDALVGTAMMFMANKRRKADFGELPFNLNGESLFTEGKQMVDDVTNELINTMKVII